MESVGASVCTAVFNGSFDRPLDFHQRWALFDARFRNYPVFEVVNYFIWRQQDAVRNSIQGLGKAYMSHREMHGLNGSQIQDRLFREHGINWNDIPPAQKRGVCVIRVDGKWAVDTEIPIFTENREYVVNRMPVGDGDRPAHVLESEDAIVEGQEQARQFRE